MIIGAGTTKNQSEIGKYSLDNLLLHQLQI
jgi:hypothetical protein